MLRSGENTSISKKSQAVGQIHELWRHSWQGEPWAVFVLYWAWACFCWASSLASLEVFRQCDEFLPSGGHLQSCWASQQVRLHAGSLQEATAIVEWSGVEWSGVEWSGVEWSGVEWSGVEWSGVEWSGVEWSGVEWSGVEWSGVEWSGVELEAQQLE